MRLVPGDKVLVEYSTFGDRLLSVIADVRNGNRLVVYSPLTPPILERLRTDSRALVKFVQEGRLRAFRSRVLNSVTALGELVELDYPGFAVDADERCEPRCGCRFPATVMLGERSMDAVVEDMSESCARVRFREPGSCLTDRDSDREVRLAFRPFDPERGYDVSCEVQSVFMRDRDMHAVLRFSEKDREMRDRISRFVASQLQCMTDSS
ncbi:PilZ domain-containing protein [Pseudodesulfovibrio tunisiensis]|uniref:PilZ domain-containing protein n=1 Tax=Pseudodesulfovibrio tunisiensis TaxID=463192 RepID=UPI001FB249F0|nr:PilZ domain-containing protein [Pseudodesulfovibrio tunisiensis]